MRAVVASPTGELIAAGDFSAIDGVAAVGLAQWSGGVWTPLVPGFTGTVNDVAVLPDGTLAVVGSLAMNGTVLGQVGFWQAGTWSNVASSLLAPTQIVAGAAGDVFVGGDITTIGGVAVRRVARWDGATWSALGSGIGTPVMPVGAVRALAPLPNGDLLVGGTFQNAGVAVVRNLARWDGTSWSAYGDGADATVHALDASADGRVVVGGDFVRVAGVRSALVARLQPTCAAVLTPYGFPCQQAGTTLVLDTAPAWLGGSLQSSASGLPGSTIALALYGFQPAMQLLSAVLPMGAPGCFLSAQPDHVTLALASGQSHQVLPIPRVPALAGVNLFHQVLSLELTAGGAFASLASTPAVVATLGSLW